MSIWKLIAAAFQNTLRACLNFRKNLCVNFNNAGWPIKNKTISNGLNHGKAKTRIYYFSLGFHLLGSLGRVSHRVKMSVCLSIPDAFFLRRLYWPWDHMISFQASHWSIIYVQNVRLKLTSKIYIQNWRQRLKSKIDVQNWSPKFIYKINFQNLRPKFTSKIDIQNLSQKFKSKIYVQNLSIKWKYKNLRPKLTYKVNVHNLRPKFTPKINVQNWCQKCTSKIYFQN